MKQFIVTIALIILGVYIANTLILDSTNPNSMRSGVDSVTTKMINQINVINN